MKKLLVLAIAVVMVIPAGVAFADGPVTRTGANYSGIRNPNGCQVGRDDKHPSELRAKCTSGIGATGPAFVRYRFLKNVGAIRDDAKVSADIVTWIGKACTVKWMVRKTNERARTLRVTIPFGSYCHIRSVTWWQS
jgi:hypothetical protein